MISIVRLIMGYSQALRLVKRTPIQCLLACSSALDTLSKDSKSMAAIVHRRVAKLFGVHQPWVLDAVGRALKHELMRSSPVNGVAPLLHSLATCEFATLLES